MPWSDWSDSKLLEELAKIDKDLYKDLKSIIPTLKGDKWNEIELSTKSNLVSLLMSFSSSDYFSKKQNMYDCLMHLKPQRFKKLISELTKNGFLVKSTDFEKSVKNIQKIKWNNKEFATLFLNFFNLPDHFMPPDREQAPSFVDIFPISDENPLPLINKPYKMLIDYQNQVYSKANEELKIPRTRFIIQMPTGSGKTRTSMEVISNHIKNSSKDSIVLWLAHSSELCEQSFQCFIETWQYSSNKNLKAIRYWGNHPKPDDCDEPMFIVGGFQKLNNILSKDQYALNSISQRISLIVIDEAHKAVAPTYKKVISILKNNETKIIGLTATPGRAEVEETKEMSDFFFGEKININPVGYSSEIEMLKSKKVLAKINYKAIISPLNLQLSPYQKNKLQETFDFPPSFIKTAATSNIRNIEIMQRLLSSCKQNGKILFFSCSVKHSKFIVSLLLYFGIKAAHVDGSTKRARREQVIEDFRNGDIQVLCNFGVLTTGFDAPNTNEVFISRPTNSVVLYSQMIGRGLRGPAIGGTPECIISDVRDNIIGFSNQERVYHWFEDFWDTVE